MCFSRRIAKTYWEDDEFEAFVCEDTTNSFASLGSGRVRGKGREEMLQLSLLFGFWDLILWNLLWKGWEPLSLLEH